MVSVSGEGHGWSEWRQASSPRLGHGERGAPVSGSRGGSRLHHGQGGPGLEITGPGDQDKPQLWAEGSVTIQVKLTVRV